MISLGLGLVAALAWGVHDLCVRSVSRRADTLACLGAVFALGLALVLPLWVWQQLSGDPDLDAAAAGRAGVGLVEIGRGVAVGALFALANYGLYRAFASGPVRLVAPVTAAYPVLSVGLAALGGAAIGADRWLAVAAVISGIALVASTVDPDEPAFDRRVALGWSIAAAVGFASTFALGQHLSAAGGAVATLVVTRAVALAAVLLAMLGGAGLRAPPRDAWPLVAVMAAADALALGAVFLAGGLPDAAFATVTASMFGAVTIVLARAVFGERLAARQWAGVGVAFAAIGYLAGAA